MINHIKGVVASMASGLLKILQGTVIRSLKIEALKLYVRTVGIARNFSIFFLTSIAMLLLAMLAFVMVHAGILILLPLSIEIKGWIILMLGIIYGLIAYTVISNMCSEKYWLEMTNASKMINDAVKNESEKKD
jgi:formate hydrogenlyase subunit 4